ncbi:MAG: type II toxin-antitoxin system HicB family antitoxin [Clostridia bacterium]|nr:type II toxin-antitoxin system HicB family antitoxin [Clostridia bacterium]
MKFTYPMVFIFNEDESVYNGYIPDLTLYCEGETLESVYASAEELIKYYFELAVKYDTEIPTPSPMEEVSQKWTGYKVSLITADIPDKETEK